MLSLLNQSAVELSQQQVTELQNIATTLNFAVISAVAISYVFGEVILKLKVMVDNLETEVCVFVGKNGFSYGNSPDGQQMTDINQLVGAWSKASLLAAR